MTVSQSYNMEKAEELGPSWALPVIGFMIYVLFTMLAYFSHQQGLNTVGFMTLMLFVAFDWIRKAFSPGLRFDIVTHLSLLGIVIMAVSAGLNFENVDATHLIKYICLFILYIMIFSGALPSLTFSPKRIYLLMASVFVILVSLVVKDLQFLGDAVRYSGIFPNPNTFALFCFGLLFLITNEDSIVVKLAVHSLVLVSLLLAGGSGALLAYIAGMVYLYFSLNRDKSFLLYSVFFLIMSCILFELYIITGIEINAVELTITKVELIYELRDELLSGPKLDWAWINSHYDHKLLSGLWRLAHWRHQLLTLFNSDLLQVLFGFGQGSMLSTSILMEGKEAHNDLVRFLYEVGIVGTLLIISFFYMLFKRLELQYKYVALAVFLYSLSENNFDGFLFMTIFIFVLASNQANRWPTHHHPYSASN